MSAEKTIINIYIMAFLAGFSVMSVELVASKLLAPFFGSSIYVWGSIITIFMLSLALGYLWGGKLSAKHPSFKKYCLLYFFSGCCVLLVPVMFDVLQVVSSKVSDPRYGSLMGAFLLFSPLSILLGMISPYSIRLLIDGAEKSGKIAGRLYFISTIGSALGTILTSFYFVLIFNLNEIIVGIGIVLITLSFSAWFQSLEFSRSQKKKSLAINEAH